MQNKKHFNKRIRIKEILNQVHPEHRGFLKSVPFSEDCSLFLTPGAASLRLCQFRVPGRNLFGLFRFQ